MGPVAPKGNTEVQSCRAVVTASNGKLPHGLGRIQSMDPNGPYGPIMYLIIVVLDHNILAHQGGLIGSCIGPWAPGGAQGGPNGPFPILGSVRKMAPPGAGTARAGSGPES